MSRTHYMPPLIECRRHGVEILSAPPEALISLALVNKADVGLTVEGDKITLGSGDFGTVTYQVTGWLAGALLVWRVDPPVGDDEPVVSVVTGEVRRDPPPA